MRVSLALSVAASPLLEVLPAVATGPSPAPISQSAVSTSQYTLANSDGSTWQEIGGPVGQPEAPIFNLRLTASHSANQFTLLTASADLWTNTAGYNQDLGIFVSDNGGPDTMLAWQESGGFAGTYSPNAAYVQYLYNMASGHAYVFKLKWKTNKNAPGATIYSGAGPIGGKFSPTSLLLETFPVGATPIMATKANFSSLTGSDGTTWQPIDATLTTGTLSPGSNSTEVLGGDADLFTDTSGYNQDIGIFVSVDGTAPTLVAWKESGGFGGSYSPNAAYVKEIYPMTGGHTYNFSLRWKTNKNAPGVTIYAGAGSGSSLPGRSPTSLVAETLAASANPYTAVKANFSSLLNSDGATWQPMDSALDVSVSPAAYTNSIVGANADLWTDTAGYNQDLGIFVSDNGGADTLGAWKESGGIASTYSPNAAFAQTVYPMSAGHTYRFKLKWKTNKSATGATTYAGAGPIAGQFSPTRLSVELTGISNSVAWGYNYTGQLGNGATTNTAVPVPVSLPSVTTLTAVAAGGGHSLAVTSTGSVFAWGNNYYGELGNGTTTNSAVPVPVSLPSGTTITSVAAGYDHSLALTSTGSVLAWGTNGQGQLGNGTTTNSTLPVPVSLPSGTTITAIAAGWNHSLAVTSTGSVLAWGYNAEGQLGNGTTVDSAAPVPVSLPSGTNVTTVAAGGDHSLAVTSTGSVLAWGANAEGQLGNGTTTRSTIAVPVSLRSGTRITAVASGGYHSLAVTSTGSVFAWGHNYYGQLGNGTTASSTVPVAVSLPSGTTVTTVAAGFYHSLALTSTSSVLAWGANFDGQGGNGTAVDSAVPVSASLPSGTIITAIAAGSAHSLAIVR